MVSPTHTLVSFVFKVIEMVFFFLKCFLRSLTKIGMKFDTFVKGSLEVKLLFGSIYVVTIQKDVIIPVLQCLLKRKKSKRTK